MSLYLKRGGSGAALNALWRTFERDLRSVSTGWRFFLCSSSCLLNVCDRGIPTRPFRESRRPRPRPGLSDLTGVCGGVCAFLGSGHGVCSSLFRHLLKPKRSLNLLFCSLFSSWVSFSASKDAAGEESSAIGTAMGMRNRWRMKVSGRQPKSIGTAASSTYVSLVLVGTASVESLSEHEAVERHEWV